MPPQAPASLRRQLLGRLLPALLLLLLAGAGTAYWVAWRSANKAYDRALFDAVLALSQQLHVVDGQTRLHLSDQARNILLVDKFDQIFYVIRRADGRILDGDADLPLPPPGLAPVTPVDPRYYYDGQRRDQSVRVAAVHRELGGQRYTIAVAETRLKRVALVREILLGMLIPEICLALVTVIVIWFGIRAGLRPLESLRTELAGRSPADLRPLATSVPEELGAVTGEVNALMERLEQALTSQRNLVADAAHQLRTPLAALQAQVDAASGATPGEAPAALAGIRHATRRLTHLVSQLLALARAEPSAPQRAEIVDLAQLIRQAADRWLPRAIAADLDVGFELAPAPVRGNRLLLEEMTENLVDNAFRHTPAGGSLTIACGDQDGRSWLTVEDSGPGIAAEQRERVFERFYRAPGTRGDGCGLGLAIVRTIAGQHGGQASAAASARLGGALLRVDLPALSVRLPG